MAAVIVLNPQEIYLGPIQKMCWMMQVI